MDIRKNSEFIVNAFIEQICYGLYDLQIQFNIDLTISTGRRLEYRQSNGNIHYWTGENGRDFFSMNGIIEIPVIATSVENSGTLHIFFENGDEIVFIAVDEPYEQFMLTSRESFQVVFHINHE